MPYEDEHWCEVRVRMREVKISDLQPGDKIWYWVKKFAAKKSPMNRDVHGPFVVVDVDAGVIELENAQGVAVTLAEEAIIPLAIANDPPQFG